MRPYVIVQAVNGSGRDEDAFDPANADIPRGPPDKKARNRKHSSGWHEMIVSAHVGHGRCECWLQPFPPLLSSEWMVAASQPTSMFFRPLRSDLLYVRAVISYASI